MNLLINDQSKRGLRGKYLNSNIHKGAGSIKRLVENDMAMSKNKFTESLVYERTMTS